MKFNGELAYFVSPANKYGLSKKEPKVFANTNFTYVTRAKIDWDKLVYNTLTADAGIIVKNGLHAGIMAFRDSKNETLFRGAIWVTDSSGQIGLIDQCIYVHEDDHDKIFDLSFTHNKEEKKIIIGCNGEFYERVYEGEIVDYSSSWIWIGCANALESCEPEHQNFFYGDIDFGGIFSCELSKEEISHVFNTQELKEEYNPLCFFDFKTQTPYKILDETKNGNNLVRYDKTWFESIG